MQECLLIVGDASYIKMPTLLGQLLPKQPNIELSCCNADSVIRTISNKDITPVAILLSLRQEEERKYMDIISSTRALKPDLPIIVLVQYGADALAQKALQAGAYDYLFKPVSLDRLRLSIQHAITIKHMRSYIKRLEQHVVRQENLSIEERSAMALNQLSNMLVDANGQVKPLKQIEKEIILTVLRYSNGCVARAARNLGIGRSTLYRKVGSPERNIYNEPEVQTIHPMIDASPKEHSAAK